MDTEEFQPFVITATAAQLINAGSARGKDAHDDESVFNSFLARETVKTALKKFEFSARS